MTEPLIPEVITGNTIKTERGGILTPWKKGQSGNPSGRSKGKSWADTVKQLGQAKKLAITLTLEDGRKKYIKLESDRPLREAVVAALYAQAINGDTKAAKQLADRAEGSPHQSIQVEQTGNQEGLVINIQQAQAILPPAQPQTALPEKKEELELPAFTPILQKDKQ